MLRLDEANIGFVGAGHMASALLEGLINSGVASEQLWLCDHNDAKTDHWQDLGVHIANDAEALCDQCDAIVLAVRPDDILDTMMEIQRHCDHHITHPSLVISLAAGIPLEQMMPFVPQDIAMIRAMPNLPVKMGMGATVLFAEEHNPHRDFSQLLFEKVGTALWVEEENMLHLATALAGSGPGFFFRWMEAMQQQAQVLGMPEDQAASLVKQVALGSAHMAKSSSDSVGTLRQQVASPGGVTEKGLGVLDAMGIDAMLLKMLESALMQSKDMSDGS